MRGTMRVWGSVIALFLIGAINVLFAAAQNDAACNAIAECGVCTGGGNAATNKCVWCLNNNAGLPVTLADQAGSCAITCSDQASAQLGIPETKTTKTFRDGYDEAGFVGIDTTKEYVELRRATRAEFSVTLTKGPVPFQLYFLLDLSESMTNILEAVKKAGSSLPGSFDQDNAKIKPIFEFGFGSFIDKALPPFTYDRFDFAVPTYGFKHEVSFLTDGKAFEKELSAVTVSGNNDAPEGGLDAVVQALYCEELLGWRRLDTNALRLILMTTDDTSHVAGDGIEAGLVWPHELKCHNQFYFGKNDLFISELMNPLNRKDAACPNLDGSKCWYHNVVHDYPSVDQIAQGLRDRKTNIAFVVPPQNSVRYPGRYEHYKDIVDKSLGSNGVVANDPLENSADLKFTTIVRNTYFQLLSKKPEFEAINGGDVEFDDFYIVTSECKAKLERDGGERIQVEQVNGRNIFIDLKFDCDFVVTMRTSIGSPKNLTQVQSQGTFGSFEVMVRSSSCACPAPPNPYFSAPVNAEKCNNEGTTSETNCGECECNPGATGEVCACSEKNKFRQCEIAVTSGLPCNGVGSCECGKCKCPAPYYGPACECSDQCDEPDNEKRCGGATRGTCECESCNCKTGFTGPKCECNNNDCVNEGDTEPCSGVEGAECNCGKCSCPEPYSGEFCQFCDPVKAAVLGKPDECGVDVCSRCTQKLGDDSEPSDDTWGCQCCFQIPGGSEGLNNTKCQWCYQANQCIARETISIARVEQQTVCSNGFSTIINENNESIRRVAYAVHQNIEECRPPAQPDVTAIVTGTLLGLLALIILALLLWRLLAYMNDKKEWENYEKDKARSKWQADNNPIFKSSVAEFENPIFE